MKFIFMISILLLSSSFSFDSSNNQGQVLIPFLKDGLYGYSDIEGQIIIEPQFENVSFFGYDSVLQEFEQSLFPSQINRSNNLLPPNLAHVLLDDQWHIINKKGHIVLSSSTDSQVTIKGMYAQKINKQNRSGKNNNRILSNIMFESITDSNWAIFDMQTESIKHYQKIENCHPSKYLEDQISIGDSCHCLITKSISGQYEMLTEGGYMLQDDVDADFRCRTKEAHQLCDKLYKEFTTKNPQYFSYHRSKKKAKPFLKKKYVNNHYILLARHGNPLNDKTYDAIEIIDRSRKRGLGSKHNSNAFKGAVCLDKNSNQLDVYNREGQLVRSVKSETLPDFKNLSDFPHYVFIDGSVEKIFINEQGHEALTDYKYQKINTAFDDCILAQIGEDYLPFHLYDSTFQLKVHEEIYDVEKSKGDLIAKVKRTREDNFSYKLLESNGYPYHFLEGENLFDDIITLGITTYDPKNRKSDLILSIPEKKEYKSIRDLKEIPPEIKELMLEQGIDPDSKPNMALFFKPFSNRPDHGYRLYIKEQAAQKRFVLAKHNEVLMDTIADGFSSFNVTQKVATLFYGEDSIEVSFSKNSQKLYREYFPNTRIHTQIIEDTLFIKDVDNQLIYEYPNIRKTHKTLNHVLASGDALPLTILSNNRVILYTEEGFIILNKFGKVLDNIKSDFNHGTLLSNATKSDSYKDLIMFSNYKLKTTCRTNMRDIPSGGEYLYNFQKLKAFKD